jgi:hypothetical protein
MNLRRFVTVLVCAILLLQTAISAQVGPVRVSPNGRYFVDKSGKPLFWLGDTEWFIFWAVSLQDAKTILDNRKSKGFTFIQIMVSYNGNNANLAGQKPFLNDNPLTPNEAFFKHADSVIQYTEQLDLMVVLGIFHGMETPQIVNAQNLKQWASWIARRYHNEPNLVWCMYPWAGNIDLPRLAAAGILEADSGRHLISLHPDPTYSGGYAHGESWLSFVSSQTGCTLDSLYAMATRDYARTPAKPVVTAEGAYEGNYCGRNQTALDMRNQAFMSFLAGAFNTYGHIGNYGDPGNWRSWVDAPGAMQMPVIRGVFAARDWWNLVPDQSVFASGAGTGASMNTAARSSKGEWVMAYLSGQRTVSIAMGKVTASSTVDAYWIDPRSGAKTVIGNFPNTGARSFTTPQGWEDALLVLEKPGLTSVRRTGMHQPRYRAPALRMVMIDHQAFPPQRTFDLRGLVTKPGLAHGVYYRVR